MRGITLALIGSVCLFTSVEQAALAADMPRKAPIKAPAPVVYDWTGLYAGAHLGYGWGMKDWLDFGTPLSPNELIGSYPVRGGLLGGQVGLNYQIGHVVVGVEAAASWSGLRGDLPIAIGEIGFASKSTTEVKWLSTVTGHVGATVGRWLVSGKAGVAWLRENHTYRSVFGAIVIDDGSLAETRSGPTAGLRVEYALDTNWSVRAEYDYMHVRSRTTPFIGVTVAPISIE
jgi:outer membrane immunogenic protein